jgi:hypothetical protein
VWIDRDAVGYEEGIFPFQYGGVYCASSTEPDCDPSTNLLEDRPDKYCIPFTEEFSAPTQTLISAGQLGELSFVTFPGEPGTLLAEQVMAEMRASGAGDIAFFGYSQDYLGYAILEDDWWQGGYEAAGALWGPQQGAYLAGQAAMVFDEFVVADAPVDFSDLMEPAPVVPFDVSDYPIYDPESPADVGTVLVDVAAAYTAVDTIAFTVAGTDPWLGAPLAYLEHADGTPVTRPGGQAWTSDEYLFQVRLATTPTYADQIQASERRFEWTFALNGAKRVVGAGPTLDGDYRLRVEVPREDGTTDEVVSATFTVGPG